MCCNEHNLFCMVLSLPCEKHYPTTHLLVWASSGLCLVQTCSVLITRPYHWPGTQLNLTAGPATDLRGYEPNEPAHWWDGFRQAIPQSPWGALPQSHSSPPSAVSASSVSFILLSEICLWKTPPWFGCLHTYQLSFHISCMFKMYLLAVIILTNSKGFLSEKT